MCVFFQRSGYAIASDSLFDDKVKTPKRIEAGDTRIILAVSRFDICGWMITKATAFLGVTIIYSV